MVRLSTDFGVVGHEYITVKSWTRSGKSKLRKGQLRFINRKPEIGTSDLIRSSGHQKGPELALLHGWPFNIDPKVKSNLLLKLLNFNLIKRRLISRHLRL